MKRLQDATGKIPLWVYNILTIVSSLIAIVTFVVGVIRWITNKSFFITPIIILAGVIAILVLRIFKYRKLLRERMKMTSAGIHDLSHAFRDTFFDILHEYKLGQLTVPLLTKEVEDCIQTGLDSLCNIMTAFTGAEVSACIKLIECAEDSGEIDVERAKIRVFCRSRNSDRSRVSYDHSQERTDMYLKDDTVLMRIVGPQAQQDHFYYGDLDKFKRACEEAQESYNCPNKHREKYYIGTMVLPIRILFQRLYYYERNDAYHVIGFLCVDSLSQNAFQINQEDYNCKVGNAFADMFYVILSKYRHYLNKLAAQTPAKEIPDENK